MENRCAACHELTFDPGAPDRQLPHGKPREVVLTLQDYFTRKFSDPNAGRSTRERRRLPGHEEEQTCTARRSIARCAARMRRSKISSRGAAASAATWSSTPTAKAISTASRSTRSASRATTSRRPLRSSQPPDPGQAHRRCGMPVLSQGEGIAGQQGPDAAGDGQVRGVPRRSSGRRKSGRAMRELSLVPSATGSRCRGARIMKKTPCCSRS